jgi:hypothetical protein
VLPAHTALVELARERLTATLLASTVVWLGGQVCAWVTARLQPGSGKVIWVVVLNGAGGTCGEATRASVAAAIADLQAQTGIPAVEGAGPGMAVINDTFAAAMPDGLAEDATLGYRPRHLRSGRGRMWPGPPQRRRGGARLRRPAGHRLRGRKACPASAPRHVQGRCVSFTPITWLTTLMSSPWTAGAQPPSRPQSASRPPQRR